MKDWHSAMSAMDPEIPKLPDPPADPWMDPREVALIMRYLIGKETMLEWGSGGSTQTFAPCVERYYSIEHNAEWAACVQAELPPNVTFIHQDPEWPHEGVARAEEGQFDRYVGACETFGQKHFDAILIDGRARMACFRESIQWTQPGGVVFIHDFWRRPAYWKQLERFFSHFRLIDGSTLTSQTLAVFERL